MQFWVHKLSLSGPMCQYINVMNRSAHEIFVLIVSPSSEGSDEPVHACSLARAYASRIHKIESPEKLKQNIKTSSSN